MILTLIGLIKQKWCHRIDSSVVERKIAVVQHLQAACSTHARSFSFLAYGPSGLEKLAVSRTLILTVLASQSAIFSLPPVKVYIGFHKLLKHYFTLLGVLC